MTIGIALHHGDAAYGNVGSGQRLDFTVIGRDVNLASRIAKLNKSLGEPLLMSKPFVEHLWGNPTPLGAFEVDGFDERSRCIGRSETGSSRDGNSARFFGRRVDQDGEPSCVNGSR